MNYGKEFYQEFPEYAADVNAKEVIRLSYLYGMPTIKGNVLDIGAGSGALMDTIRELNYVHPLQQQPIDEIKGIDIAPTRQDVIEAGIDKIPFDDKYFDCVTCTATLEHLDDKTYTDGLREVNRVLKRNGFFIFTVPYKEDMKQSRIVCPGCYTTFHRWGHIQTFDKEKIRGDMSYGGFEIRRLLIIPLGFMAKHSILKYFVPIIKRTPIYNNQQTMMYVIAQKN